MEGDGGGWPRRRWGKERIGREMVWKEQHRAERNSFRRVEKRRGRDALGWNVAGLHRLMRMEARTLRGEGNESKGCVHFGLEGTILAVRTYGNETGPSFLSSRG